MMERTPKRRRRAYLDDFKPNAAGSYVYCGKLFAFCGNASALRRFRLLLGLFWLLLFASEIGAGCLDVGELDNTMPVLIPYMLQILLAAAFLWSAGRLLFAGNPLREYVYRQTVLRLPLLGFAFSFGAIATAVCAAIRQILQKQLQAAHIVYIALFLLAACCALCCVALIRKADWEESRKDDANGL